MKSLKVALTDQEKQSLKQNRLKIRSLAAYAPDELCNLLHISLQRANEIHALIEFQQIPSVGPKFAMDLIALGINSIDDLVGRDGPALFDQLERQQGFWTDPCVEDQFWLVVHYAQHRGSNKNWWDFTADRKAFRARYGYPKDRPETAWHELTTV